MALQVMETVCNKENTDKDFPVTMGVNAFRGFMNEFTQLTKLEAEKPGKLKRKKEKKQKGDEPIKYAGHIFHLTIINIPTACEICSSFFMWPLERGLVCQSKFKQSFVKLDVLLPPEICLFLSRFFLNLESM